jgi:Domain of unknown function (DUF6784)/Family of unknown function (DUF6785)
MAPTAAPERAPRQTDLAPAHAITRRAVLLGTVAIFANAAWVAYMEPIKAAGRTTIFSLFLWFNRAYRSHPMGFQLEGLKIAERERIAGDTMVRVMLLAGLVGMLAGFWALLTPYYRLGIGTADVIGNPRGFGRQSYARLAGWLAMPTPPDALSPDFVAAGVGVVMLLSWLRVQWVGFPLHPVAFAVSGSWNMNLLWVPLGVAWLLKALTLRYGGLRLYRNLIPFFMGLILGDFVSLTLWNLAAVVGDFPGYHLFYN